MLRTFLATASVAAVLASGAIAQTQSPTTPARPAPMERQAPAARTAPADSAVHLSANEFSANKLIGISIYAPKPDNATAAASDPATTASTTASPASAGAIAPSPVSDEQWRGMRDRHDSIGKIDDLVIGADGRITHAVIGVGGFLGIGEKKVALELREVKLMRQSDGTVFGVVMRTKQQLQEMPRFAGERT